MNLLDLTQADFSCEEYIDVDELMVRFAEHPPQPIKEGHPTIVCIDTESEHYHWFKPEVNAFCFTISWAKDHTYYVPIDEEAKAAEALNKILNYGDVIVFHNAKYDLHVINKICRKSGVEMAVNWSVIHDTMLMSHCLNENRNHGLKELCDEYKIKYSEADASELKKQIEGWIKDQKEFTGEEPSYRDVPDYMMVPYAVQDAYLTYGLFCHFYWDLVEDQKRDEILKIYNIERELLKVLFEAEERGVRVDLDFCYEQIASLTPQVEVMIEECKDIAEMIEFNPLSVDDVATFLKKFNLFDRDTMVNKTTGKVNLPEWALEKIDHPIAQKVLKCRLYTKLLSAYFQAIVDFHRVEDGGASVISCNFKQIGARTGRMSVTEPALQTLPKEKGNVRGAFISRENHKLIFADYASQELRILAHYTFTKDPGITQIFVENRDLHAEAAMAFFGRSRAEDVTVEERKRAKGVNFAIVYGAGQAKLSKILKVSDDEGKDLLEKYHSRFPGIKWLKYTAQGAMEKRGYVVTVYGRRHRLVKSWNKDGSPKMDRWGKRQQTNAYKALNSLVQGTAADMAKVSMIKIAKAFDREGMKSQILLQVHDEIIVEAPDEEVERAQIIIRDCMIDCPELKLPMEIDMHTANRWSEAIG